MEGTMNASTQSGEASTSTEQQTTAGSNTTTQVSGTDTARGVSNYYLDTQVAQTQGGRLNNYGPDGKLKSSNEDQTVESFNPAAPAAEPTTTEVKQEETITMTTEQQQALNSYLDSLHNMISAYESIPAEVAQNVVGEIKTANSIGSQIEKNNEGIQQAKEQLKNDDLNSDEKMRFIQSIAKYEIDNQSLTSQLNFLREKLGEKDIELEILKSEKNDPFKQSMNETDKSFLGAKKSYESNKGNAYYESIWLGQLLSEIKNITGEDMQSAINAALQRKAHNFKANPTSGINLPQAQATIDDAKKDAIRNAINSLGQKAS